MRKTRFTEPDLNFSAALLRDVLNTFAQKGLTITWKRTFSSQLHYPAPFDRRTVLGSQVHRKSDLNFLSDESFSTVWHNVGLEQDIMIEIDVSQSDTQIASLTLSNRRIKEPLALASMNETPTSSRARYMYLNDIAVKKANWCGQKLDFAQASPQHHTIAEYLFILAMFTAEACGFQCMLSPSCSTSCS